MRVALDTNVLIYAHLPAFEQHTAVRDYLQALLHDSESTVVVTPAILQELVHVITDPKRFQPPVSMAEAIALARRYTGRANVECLPLSPEAMLLALTLLERHGLGRRRVADTLLAACLLHHGVDRLVTCNPADFQIFEGIEVVDPRNPHLGI